MRGSRRRAAARLCVAVSVLGVALGWSAVPAGADVVYTTALEAPATVTRGVSATFTVTFTNNSTGTDTDPIPFESIVWRPSSYIGLVAGSFPVEYPDPGAFAVASAASGAGGATCAGDWTVAETGSGTGTFLLSPPGGGALMVAKGSPCVVTLSAVPLRKAVDDGAAADGIQFRQSLTHTNSPAHPLTLAFPTFQFAVGDVDGAADPVSNLDDPYVDRVSVTPAPGKVATGTVRFRTFDEADCTGTALSDTTATLVDGSATSDPVSSASVGTRYWLVDYSGDAFHPSSQTVCNAPGQATAVVASSLELAATPSPGTQSAPGSPVVVAVTITYTEGSFPAPQLHVLRDERYGDLLDAANSEVEGNTCPDLAFDSFGPVPLTCEFTIPAPHPVGITSSSLQVQGVASFFGTVAVDPDITTYEFEVTNPGPAVTRQASAGVVVGGAIADSMTLTGGTTPVTGTITYSLYRTSQNCAGTPVAIRAKSVNGTGTYTSDPYTTTEAGDYRWLATYSGDANNAGSTGTCSDANQTVSVAKASPTLAKTSTGGTVGQPITSTATVTGGYQPTGTVTFQVFKGANCNGTALATVERPLGSNGKATASFTPSSDGTYRWTATYAGDVNNNAATSPCNSPSQVTKRPTSLSVSPTLVRFFPFQLNFGTVSARLTNDGAPVVGQPVTFRSGGTLLCTANTNVMGRATCKPVTFRGRLALLISGRVQANYPGNATYLPSSGSAGRFG